MPGTGSTMVNKSEMFSALMITFLNISSEAGALLSTSHVSLNIHNYIMKEELLLPSFFRFGD